MKSSLAAPGPTVGFRINCDGQFQWQYENTSDSLSATKEPQLSEELSGGKLERAAYQIIKALMNGPQRASDITSSIEKTGMFLRTIKLAKKMIGIVSYRKGGVWHWKLPTNDGKYPSIEPNADSIEK